MQLQIPDDVPRHNRDRLILCAQQKNRDAVLSCIIGVIEMSQALLADYHKLMERMKQVAILDSANSILHWDMETKMPPRGITQRSLQLAQLAQFLHRMTTDAETGRLLMAIGESPEYDSLDTLQKRDVYLSKRMYEEATCLPEDLVVETARQEAVATDIWKKAKASRDFALFRPELEKLVELKIRAAELLKDVKGVPTPYDALIDTYEPSVTSTTISDLFSSLRQGLASILKRYLSSSQPRYTSLLYRKVPVDLQRKISEAIVAFLGYDTVSKTAGGRIDETEHPFTSGSYDDIRITTHYYEDNFTSSVFSILHEAGHALYEQGLNPEWQYRPIGASCSLGIHESQSRFVENIVGRSPAFWTYFLPKIKMLTGSAFLDASAVDFARAVNVVRPSKIRIEADEVTYCLHIIIRFELEKELISGRLQVSELPEVWNQKYEDYLGLEIENDSEGVMQDAHWASGSYGYFPTYALGNIYSGQILATMEKAMPTWMLEISRGDFKQARQWLTDNVYCHGNLHNPRDLVRTISGQDVNIQPYIRYLDMKCHELYP